MAGGGGGRYPKFEMVVFVLLLFAHETGEGGSRTHDSHGSTFWFRMNATDVYDLPDVSPSTTIL